MIFNKYEKVMEPRTGNIRYPYEGSILKEEDFLYFEKKNNLILPKNFKLFYLEYNGCYFEDANFEVYGDDLKKHISYGQISEIGYTVNLTALCALEYIEKGTHPGQPSWTDANMISYDPIPYQEWPIDIQESNPLSKGWDPIFWEQYLIVGYGGERDILMGMAYENMGKIYYWDSNFDNIYDPIYLADSIPELLDKTEAMQTFNQT
jgi:hypothetical protein